MSIVDISIVTIEIPDIPGKNGERSTSQIYLNELARQGLDVAGVHFHWTGTGVPMIAVHTQNIGMNPADFSKRVIQSIEVLLRSLNR